MSARITAALAIALFAGCSRPQEEFPPLQPLSGTVVRDGKPVTEGGLIFLPLDRGTGLVVDAAVLSDGSFVAQTSRTRPTGGIDARPGAAAGRYRAVYHPPSEGQKTGLETQLEAVVEVAAGGTTVTLTLPAKLPAGNGADRDDDPKSPRFDPNHDK